jgi:APA family basic amino acid/polyamine antiporter
MALAVGLVSAFFSFGGWWDVSRMAGELREPGRTLPRALLSGIPIVTLIYISVSAVFLYLVPLDQVQDDQSFAARVGEILFGRIGGVIFASVVIITVLGSLASIIMGAPRVYYAMARDGLFPRGVAAVHPRFGTPARAIVIQALVACLLIASGTFDEILGYFFFSAVAFVALTISALFVIRSRSAAMAEYKTPGYPLTPLLFLVPIAGLLVLIALRNPLRAGIGVGIVALGLPVYWLVVRGRDSGSRST